jgi:hypothetical protein
LRARAQIVYKFEEILSCAHVNFEEQNKVFEPSIIIIIIIIIIIMPFDRFTTKESYTWNITHNTESTAV